MELARRRALALGTAALALAGHAARAVEPEVARVVAPVGSVRVLREGVNGGFEALAAGAPLSAGDIIRTGPDGRVQVLCLDGLTLFVGSGTEFVLRTILVDRPGGLLEAAFGLLRGIVRLVGGEASGRHWIEVDTRTAVASVRSTEWLVELTARGTGVLSVEGVVEVRGLAGGAVGLRPGQGTDVPPGGTPRPAATWGEARRRDALARTTL